MNLQEIQGLAAMEMAAMETDAFSNAIASTIVGVISLVIILLIAFASSIVLGIMCKRLARHKGYTGYFWTGFFFGVIGLIYVVGLPDLNARKDTRAVMKRLVSVNDRVTALEEQQFNKQY